MPRLTVVMSLLVLGFLAGCGRQDGPKLPSGTGPSSAQNTSPGSGNQPAGGAHTHPVAAGGEDECCPSEGTAGPVAGPVTGNEPGHECNCGQLKPGCKCGHCSGAIPTCHCRHDKKPGQ